eukprot:1334562-Amorphochlora_amoeboformis.AAC.1
MPMARSTPQKGMHLINLPNMPSASNLTEQDLETLKRKASKAARTLFKLSTSVLSMCVTIVDDFIRECKDKMKKAKTAKMKSKPDETPKMPNHSSDLLLFSMFCIVRVGFDNGKVGSCLDFGDR